MSVIEKVPFLHEIVIADAQELVKQEGLLIPY